MQTHRTVIVVALFSLAACGGDEGTAPPIDDGGAQLVPDMDNTLYEDPLGQLSNGAGEYVFAGVSNQPAIRRALLRFDLAASEVPAGATIDSVRLTLHMSRSNAGPTTVAVHRLTAAWGEGVSDAAGAEGEGALVAPGEATWVHTFFDTDQWASPGGDFVATASSSALVQTTGFYTWQSSPGMVADVQGWLDNPAANFGWIVVGDESSPVTAKRFDSRENSIAGNRPRLTVFFTP